MEGFPGFLTWENRRRSVSKKYPGLPLGHGSSLSPSLSSTARYRPFRPFLRRFSSLLPLCEPRCHMSTRPPPATASFRFPQEQSCSPRADPLSPLSFFHSVDLCAYGFRTCLRTFYWRASACSGSSRASFPSFSTVPEGPREGEAPSPSRLAASAHETISSRTPLTTPTCLPSSPRKLPSPRGDSEKRRHAEVRVDDSSEEKTEEGRFKFPSS